MQMSLNLHLITEKLNNSAKLFEKLEKYQFSITNSVSDIMSLLYDLILPPTKLGYFAAHPPPEFLFKFHDKA